MRSKSPLFDDNKKILAPLKDHFSCTTARTISSHVDGVIDPSTVTSKSVEPLFAASQQQHTASKAARGNLLKRYIAEQVAPLHSAITNRCNFVKSSPTDAQFPQDHSVSQLWLHWRAFSAGARSMKVHSHTPVGGCGPENRRRLVAQRSKDRCLSIWRLSYCQKCPQVGVPCSRARHFLSDEGYMSL